MYLFVYFLSHNKPTFTTTYFKINSMNSGTLSILSLLYPGECLTWSQETSVLQVKTVRGAESPTDKVIHENWEGLGRLRLGVHCLAFFSPHKFFHVCGLVFASGRYTARNQKQMCSSPWVGGSSRGWESLEEAWFGVGALEWLHIRLWTLWMYKPEALV